MYYPMRLHLVKLKNFRLSNVSNAIRCFADAKKADDKKVDAKKADCKKDGEDAKKDKKPAEPRVKAIEIYRWQPGQKPRMQCYSVDLNKSGPMVLDALIFIKNEMDPSLTFRRSCREGICGSCSCNVDGYNALSCIAKIDKDLNKPCKIYPLPHMYVIKDLISDMNNFYNQYRSIQPWLQRKDPCAEPLGTAQYLQSVEERAKLDGLYECVLCGCCALTNENTWWNNDRYLGPAMLMHTYKWVIDSRDEMHEKRLDRVLEYFKVEICGSKFDGKKCCPKKLNVGKAISELQSLICGSKTKEKPKLDTASLFKK